jgi:archaellum biogenesis ATPase FlaH
MFLTSWGRFQRRFDNILEDMKRHGELVDKEANAYDIAESRQMRQDIRAWREESLEQVERHEKEQAAKQYQTIMSWLKADESDQLAIFDAISTEGAKFPGTCSWILSNPKIRSWLEKKSDHSMLWLSGNLGTGKSVLSTQIVTFMKAAKMLVLHHFCVHSYASSTMYEQILRSLLLQLLRQDGELVAHVFEDYILGKKSPAVQALEKLLKILLPNRSHEPRQTEYIWIVIDGLDECEAQKQASVVNFMNQLTSKASSLGGMVCKVLISSGNSSIIANRLRGRHVVLLTEEKVHLDKSIRLYASQRLQFMHDKLYQLEIQTKEIEEIELEITKKADGKQNSCNQVHKDLLTIILGMFLYARLVLDYLAKNIFYSGEEMRMSVHELPDKLFDL